ncbi:YheC/YheD family protein [Brevibacillus fulvus]|uniref:Glutathione synthase/RimK-type ligase-like ATP-grasp enzyme n=1 Tax=Brevibacillus fulvus TaxID=1125967 RepID=A0A939BPP6_9BACL|nr:YheC/YheD family protein [Brevibacillus fulvus]MBM7590715.1 glutathione synthase/RimK-type ligase-like ATP-grasp enzyme [Brevibacillus fulvus]
MAKPTIGIVTSRTGKRFSEQLYLRRLVREGQELGMNIFLFAPRDVSLKRRIVNGYVPLATRGWKRQIFPWPDLVIDRYRYYPLPEHNAYLSFRKKPLFPYTSSRFSNKWNVYQVLSQDEQMQAYLPESVAYTHDQMEQMLASYPMLYIKPTNGTGGRSILQVEQKEDGFLLKGRDRDRNIALAFLDTLEELYAWVDGWVNEQRRGSEGFFIQQGLYLELLPEQRVDLRVLIQKDHKGDWDITGMAARVGRTDSSTSNLHGGGKAMEAVAVLAKYFGPVKADRILADCRRLAYRAVYKVEQHYGQMMEFGIDVGVDIEGNVWLIEMNPKPGREIFRQLGQMKRYQLAIRRPLLYALYLLQLNKAEKDLLG